MYKELFYPVKYLMMSKGFLFIVSIFVVAIVWRWQLPKIKGAFGEWLVKSKLRKLGEDYTSFHDVYIPKGDGGLTQVDHIVTSPHGLFVIETKHYKGWIFGDEFKRYWTQVIYKKKSKLYNPIRQNYGHIQALTAYLNHIVEQDIHSIIVFSTDSTFKFKKPFKTAMVIQYPELLQTILTYQNPCFDKEKLMFVNSQLENLAIKERAEKRRIRKKHMKQVKKKQDHSSQTIKKSLSVQKRCPECGGNLHLKNGRYGQFYGCSQYPKCGYTEDFIH